VTSSRSTRRSNATRQKRNRKKTVRRQHRKASAAAKYRRRSKRHTAPLYRRALERVTGAMFEPLLHAKQTLSLFMVAYGIIWSDRLGIAAVGTAMARAFGTKPKHGIKQVDRCLSNEKLDLMKLYLGYVPFIVGQRHTIGVNMDWTEFDKDDHSTVSLSLVTQNRRAIPLVWLTVKKSKLKGHQRHYERKVLRMLAKVLPPNVKVVVLADRGFGDVALYKYMREALGFDFVIRFRQAIYVMHHGQLCPSRDLVPRNGRILVLRDTFVTGRKKGPHTVVLTKAAGMAEPWCLATSLEVTDGKEVVRWYGRRFQCEEAFRDVKDRRYGYGLRFTRIRNCKRRDRFLLLFSLAYLVETLMGIGSELLGLDKELRANTVQGRTHSLFRQGRSLLGNLADETYQRLRHVFRAILRALFSQTLIEAIA